MDGPNAYGNSDRRDTPLGFSPYFKVPIQPSPYFLERYRDVNASSSIFRPPTPRGTTSGNSLLCTARHPAIPFGIPPASVALLDQLSNSPVSTPIPDLFSSLTALIVGQPLPNITAFCTFITGKWPPGTGDERRGALVALISEKYAPQHAAWLLQNSAAPCRGHDTVERYRLTPASRKQEDAAATWSYLQGYAAATQLSEEKLGAVLALIPESFTVLAEDVGTTGRSRKRNVVVEVPSEWRKRVLSRGRERDRLEKRDKRARRERLAASHKQASSPGSRTSSASSDRRKSSINCSPRPWNLSIPWSSDGSQSRSYPTSFSRSRTSSPGTQPSPVGPSTSPFSAATSFESISPAPYYPPGNLPTQRLDYRVCACGAALNERNSCERCYQRLGSNAPTVPPILWDDTAAPTWPNAECSARESYQHQVPWAYTSTSTGTGIPPGPRWSGVAPCDGTFRFENEGVDYSSGYPLSDPPPNRFDTSSGYVGMFAWKGPLETIDVANPVIADYLKVV